EKLSEICDPAGIAVHPWNGALSLDTIREHQFEPPFIIVTTVNVDGDAQAEMDEARLAAVIFAEEERSRSRAPLCRDLASGVRGALRLLNPAGLTMQDKVTCVVEWLRDDTGAMALESWTVQWSMAFEPLQFHDIDSAALF